MTTPSLLEAAKAVTESWTKDNYIVRYDFGGKVEALRQAVQAEQDVPVYTPMTDDELRGIAVRNFTYNNEEFTRNIERAVIKRLGLRWPE